MCLDNERAKIEQLRKRYPAGTRICLDEMDGEPQMPAGLKGTVYQVDDAGQIQLEWENGSTLALVPGVDRFHKTGGPEKKKEVPSR
ncbi:DUF4314 domain-containing protein [[Clostridium] scindens]|uniref:DUF4314 domain-containing protein n=1 Tax=Clostridium scindens (strain JCM 10418 / VPI 12708) TaxID=29347 RepID=UPI001D098D8B|nr:DUF4314 domain-containing protein [[Clostridium] scindens]MCB6286272.1 DUF4314 domain-containing protein [[Clostridium] scindens]MCB6421028.1 DUF4314 domain-containing protein [[Clostridium] scindens]MCB7192787.1 DUF4314 domain-containing protein [[Clostridium] scindens]MCB7285971.1 DUF4314 domain-containing protein [[Clostridium] scindens]MCG4929901.1 DUF4314 domain-containing protein [[Clostridium] scindens]